MDNSETKVKESIEVRGIAAAIQSMAMPTFTNLQKLLNEFGFELLKKENNG